MRDASNTYGEMILDCGEELVPCYCEWPANELAVIVDAIGRRPDHIHYDIANVTAEKRDKIELLAYRLGGPDAAIEVLSRMHRDKEYEGEASLDPIDYVRAMRFDDRMGEERLFDEMTTYFETGTGSAATNQFVSDAGGLRYALAALILCVRMQGDYVNYHECWAANNLLLDRPDGGRPEIERLLATLGRVTGAATCPV